MMDLAVPIDRSLPRSLSQQVADGLRRLVEDGALRPGESIPSSRELAAWLGVGRNTVITAYEQLVDSGHVTIEPRRRPFVTVGLTPRGAQGAVLARRAPDALPGQSLSRRLGPSYDLGPELSYDFRVGTPDVSAFPQHAWLGAYRAALNSPALLYPHDARGSARLRAAIAAQLVRSRAMPVAAEDIVITTGTQQGLALATRFVMQGGGRLLMEDPGYRTGRRLFTALGAHIVPVPVDDGGLITDRLPPARLIYVTPSHQFPLGGVMPLQRRQELLLWAERHAAYILEDDYDGEFRFGLPPLPTLQGLDGAGRTFYLGTISKVLAPGLRLGYLVTPPAFGLGLARYRDLFERTPDGVSQEALATLIETGAFDAHLRRMRRVYSARRETAQAVLNQNLPPGWHIAGSAAGLHLPVVYDGPGTPDLEPVRMKLRSRGVLVETLKPYSMTASLTGLVIGYGALTEQALETGLLHVCRALREADS